MERIVESYLNNLGVIVKTVWVARLGAMNMNKGTETMGDPGEQRVQSGVMVRSRG